MKLATAVFVISALASANALAQQQPTCPQLPPASGLQWDQQAGSEFLVCKANDADGRQVLGMMLTTRDPSLALARSLRAEEGQIEEEKFHWYKLDLGGRDIPNADSRRVTVVEIGKHRYAQIWIDAKDTGELSSVQSMVEHLDLQPASLALER